MRTVAPGAPAFQGAAGWAGFLAGLLLGAGGWVALREGVEHLPWAGPAAAKTRPAATPQRAPPARWDAPGEGFVVWESNRSGRWRLWIQRLDGGGLRRLTPDEGERIHCCPHVAPDGSAVAWLSLEPGPDRYPEDRPERGALRLIRPDGSGDRVLAPVARAYGEHRAAIWHGERALVYVDGEGHTVRLDVDAGKRERLTREPHPRSGWLIGPGMSHAVWALPAFSPYDPARKTVAEVQPLGGCQPYFSRDGRWGYWVAGAGGPLHKVELATGRVTPFFAKSDSRLPGEQGYLYFPMLSSDQRVLAFAASAGEHDHWRADYDVYLVETDPERLEVVGRAVRIAPHPGNDRFPDVWVAPQPLGVHTGEAPLVVRLAAPAPGGWRWSFGDGAAADGREVTHTFTRPGSYRLEARAGERALAGRVRVLAPRPPAVEEVSVRDARTLVVRFDEPVDSEDAQVALDSGTSVAGRRLAEDGRELTLTLTRTLPPRDLLRLAGIRDRAARPNPMPPRELPIDAVVWPSRRAALLFRWETGDAPNRILAGGEGVERSFAVEREGAARLDHHHRMLLGDGAFVAAAAAGEAILSGVTHSNELTLEATLVPATAAQEAAVIAFSGGRSERSNVVLLQRGDRLALRLMVAHRGLAEHDVDLGRVEPGRRTHVLVAYRPGRLRAFRNGRPVLDSEGHQGDFFRWRPRPLTFGVERGQPRAWRGTLEGIAVYGRALDAAEAAENARRYLAKAAARPAVPIAEVRAELLACSRTPTLQEISPYREALAVYEYRRAAGGDERLRVARWVVLDGERRPAAACRAGEVHRLLLEPFTSNPQLESVFLSDTLPRAPRLPLHFHGGVE